MEVSITAKIQKIWKEGGLVNFFLQGGRVTQRGVTGGWILKWGLGWEYFAVQGALKSMGAETPLDTMSTY